MWDADGIGTHAIPAPSAVAITRRHLLTAGGAAALAAAGVAWPQPSPGGLGLSAPAHLRRASYAPLVGDDLRIAGQGLALRLEAIDDLPGPGLAGRDDAFAVTLRGRRGSPLEQGTYTLSHPALGRFALFLVPTGDTRYRVVVDRSRGARL